ncbi:MAG: hypothetical protein AAGF87_15540 [Bacteroidota bacterium]
MLGDWKSGQDWALSLEIQGKSFRRLEALLGDWKSEQDRVFGLEIQGKSVSLLEDWK